jgi:hypothetical protein
MRHVGLIIFTATIISISLSNKIHRKLISNYYTCGKKVQSNPDIVPPILDTLETLSAQIPYYTVFRFPATRDKLSQTAVNSGDISGMTVAGLHEKEDHYNSFCHYPNTLRQS